MNPYHKEQIDALTTVKRHFDNLPATERQILIASIGKHIPFQLQTSA